MIYDDAAEIGDPLNNFVFGLSEDDRQGVFVDGVFAHCGEHFEGPGKLFSVAEEEGSVLVEVFIQGVEDGSEVDDFVDVAAVPILCIEGGTLSLRKSSRMASSTTLKLRLLAMGSLRVMHLYF